MIEHAKINDLATPGIAADAIAAILKGAEPPPKLLALLDSGDPAVRVTACAGHRPAKTGAREGNSSATRRGGRTVSK